jgi:hypothetical protein
MLVMTQQRICFGSRFSRFWFPDLSGSLDVEGKLVRIVDDAELFEKIPDDVGSCRVALHVQHFDGVTREVERC